MSLADKIEAVRQLGDGPTSSREDLRIGQLFLSVDPKEMSLFKFILEYDGDYKDVAEYLFDDIDNNGIRDDVLAHLQKTSKVDGIKVLSDVNDTMYANLIEKRYQEKTVYPGVLEFYDALKHEPFKLKKIPLTTLSARPNSFGGHMEEGSVKKLMQIEGGGRLCPSALSGKLFSSAVGTLQTFYRTYLAFTPWKEIPHGQEDKIGEVKFENFITFSKCYPEYRYVFVGDSGQADAMTAQLMVTSASGKGVITTFIHDLRQDKRDEKFVSSTFKDLDNDIIVTQKSRNGRAVIAYKHSAALDGLVTAKELATIMRYALDQFLSINFKEDDDSRKMLQEQYRVDAEEACAFLKETQSSGDDVKQIRQVLNENFK